jgi:hypothetical protein
MRDTIDMAREALVVPYIVGPTNAEYLERLKAFEALVRADERVRLQPKKIKAVKNEYCYGDERYYANE